MDSEDYLMLSGIQHFSFCQRQWALIHIEGLWAENTRTFGGSQMHQRADDPFSTESRGAVYISRSLPLVSHQLGISGIADVVEFHQAEVGISLPEREGLWQMKPVEYKYGKPKEAHCDLLQLTAQAICLEEMFAARIEQGSLFYGQVRRRQDVTFTAELRQEVVAIVTEMHQMMAVGCIPLAQFKASCKNCSLLQLCQPKVKTDSRFLRKYIDQIVKD